MPRIAVRREDKSQECRSPVPPAIVERLVAAGVEVVVQSAPQRVFGAEEYRAAGARLIDDVAGEPLICGIKEIPVDLLEAGKTYVFFSHTIKGQPENMPLLARLLRLGCTAIDYERIVDEHGRRLVFFGHFAGLAGTIDALWALGKRLADAGHETPLSALRPASGYETVAQAEAAIAEAGKAFSGAGAAAGTLPAELGPLVIGVAGTGNTAQGARQILDALGAEEIPPDALAGLPAGDRAIYQTYFDVHHLVERHDGGFELEEYFAAPYRYTTIFAPRYLRQLSVLMNCIYWDTPFPPLVTIRDLNRLFRAPTPAKLQVIGDISCDVGGGVQATVRATWPDDPVYVFDADSGRAVESELGAQRSFDGPGPAIVAVYNLPAELPRDASISFGEQLLPFLPAIASARYDVPLAEAGLPDEVQRAVIVHRGELMPDYRYLEKYL